MQHIILESGKCFEKKGTDTSLFDFKKVQYKGEIRYIVLYYKRQLPYKVNEFMSRYVITERQQHMQTLKQRKDMYARRVKKQNIADKCSQRRKIRDSTSATEVILMNNAILNLKNFIEYYDNKVDHFINKYEHLSNNQRAILFALKEGYKPKEISKVTGLHISTICTYISRMEEKGIC